MDEDGFIPLEWNEVPEEQMIAKANEAYEENRKRRTTRHFSSKSVDRSLIELDRKSVV